MVQKLTCLAALMRRESCEKLASEIDPNLLIQPVLFGTELPATEGMLATLAVVLTIRSSDGENPIAVSE